jgi:hypothetical protein
MNMTKKLLLGMTILLLAVLLPLGEPVWAAEARVTVLAPAEVKASGAGTAELWLHSDTPVYYFELFVSCDPQVLVFDVLTPENLGSFNITTEKREPGLARIEGSVTTLNPIAIGMLAVLTFKVVGEVGGASDISVTGEIYSARFSLNSDGAIENVEPWQVPAVFEAARVNVAVFHGLTMAVNPEGSGTTTPAGGVHDYLAGEVVEVTAVPSAGYKFSSWQGDVANPAAAVTSTTMDSGKTLVANFVLENPPPTEEEEKPYVDITPPRFIDIRTVNVAKTEAEVFWITDEISDSRVEYWAVAAQSSVLMDTNLRTSHSVLLDGLEPLTTYHYRVASRDVVGLESVSEERTFTTAGSQAVFITGDWRMDTSAAALGGNVIISYMVTNAGDTPGTYDITFQANSRDIESRSIELAAGEEKRLEFTYNIAAYGKHIFGIGETDLFLDVVEPDNVMPLVYGTGAAAAGLLLLTVGLLVFYRRNRETGFEAEAQGLPRRPVGLTAGGGEATWEESPATAQTGVDILKQSPDELRIGLGEHGLIITQAALSRLKKNTGSSDQIPARVLRISISPENPRQVKMIADFFRPGDKKVEDSGRTILLIGQEAAGLLDGVSIGYQPAEDGNGFFLSRKPLQA